MKPLTDQQARVAALVARGHTHAEIGEALGFSERNAKDHTRRLRLIAGVQRKSQLIAWCQDRERA